MKISRERLKQIIKEELHSEGRKERQARRKKRQQARQDQPASDAPAEQSQLQQLEAKQKESPDNRKIYSQAASAASIQTAASALKSTAAREHPNGKKIGAAMEGGKFYILWEW